MKPLYKYLTILATVLVSCNNDIYKDDLIHIDENIYLYHQNGEAGYSLVKEKSKNTLSPILFGSINKLYISTDTIYFASIDLSEIEKYYFFVPKYSELVELNESDYSNANKSKLLFDKSNL